MDSGYTVAWLEFVDVFTDGMDDARNVISAVVGPVFP